MMLRRSAEYALRAVLFIARSGDQGASSADRIAAALGVPRNYLGKILNQLVRFEVLTSTRGPHGGFMLAQTADRIPLERVVAPFQELPARGVCLLGNRPCTGEQPCTAHEIWRSMADPVRTFFRTTTIEQMLRETP